MIGEARRHRRSPVLPPAIFAPLPPLALVPHVKLAVWVTLAGTYWYWMQAQR